MSLAIDRLMRLAGRGLVAAVLVALACRPLPAAAEYQLVGFIEEQKVYMDTDRLQYFIDPQTNRIYYDVWTKNVYSDIGKDEMIRKIKAMGEYTKDWDNFAYALIHKYYRPDRAEFKDIGFAFMTKDDRILELGEVPLDAVKWTPVQPKTLDDDIYIRVKLYEDAYRDKMISRSVKNRYKVIAASPSMIASVDNANIKFVRDKYSGRQFADVWVRVDIGEEKVRGWLADRKKKGKPIKGWTHLGYIVDKAYYDFEKGQVLHYGMAFYTNHGVLLESMEHAPELLTNWEQPIPGSWGEEVLLQVRKYMTGS